MRILIAEDETIIRLDLRGLLERAGFELDALYGWFDRRPYAGGEDSVWVARRV